jgi:hypothetical protein
MKLDRNINGNGSGKYGLIKNRRLAQIRAWDGGDGEIADQQAVEDALSLLECVGLVEWGYPNTESEFFVIKLRDRFAHSALTAYVITASFADPEYAKDVRELADRSGLYSSFCKIPD